MVVLTARRELSDKGDVKGTLVGFEGFLMESIEDHISGQIGMGSIRTFLKKTFKTYQRPLVLIRKKSELPKFK
jgi:hypothetical protein